MAGGAEFPGAGGFGAVAAAEVGVVHQVTLGWDSIAHQIHVASLAVAQHELIAMLMAAQTGGHVGQQRHIVSLGVDVAAGAVAGETGAVAIVGELEVHPGGLGAIFDVALAVAGIAVAPIMGLLVTLQTLVCFW